MNIYYVYIYYDPRKTPAEPIYVGKGHGDRMTIHINRQCYNPILRRKVNKIRSLGLEPVLEKFAENMSNEDACKLEMELIAKYGRLHLKTGTLCNLTEGGEGTVGYKHRPETLELYSQQRKGKKQTPAQYAANCNRVISDETRQKQSIASKGHSRHTNEQLDKIRTIRLGSKHSDETRELMSEQRKGKKQTPAQYAANCNRDMSWKMKKIKCLNNGKIYDNCRSIMIDLNLTNKAAQGGISSTARGEKKHYKGYQFIYVDN